jgi:hypothetical protein
MERKQLIPSKFFQGTRKGTESLPIRILEVDIDESRLGTNFFDEAVTAAAIAVKRAEQIELERAEAESTGHILGESNASRHPAPHHAD